MTIQEDLNLEVIPAESVEEEKARHIRELRLREILPPELHNIIDEAKGENIEDLEQLKPSDDE